MKNRNQDQKPEKLAAAGNMPEEGSAETVRVRQGVTGQGVRYVLAFGLAGIVVAFMALVFLFSGG
jgi:hypothetical protein